MARYSDLLANRLIVILVLRTHVLVRENDETGRHVHVLSHCARLDAVRHGIAILYHE